MNIHLKSVRISIRNKQITKIKVLISITMAIISTVIIHACSSAVYHKGDTQMSEIEDSPHYKEGKFKNLLTGNNPPLASIFPLVGNFCLVVTSAHRMDCYPRKQWT